MYDLEEAITNRRSTRLFLRDKPVPPDARARGTRARDARPVEFERPAVASRAGLRPGEGPPRRGAAGGGRGGAAEGSGVAGGVRAHAARPRRPGVRIDGHRPPRRRGDDVSPCCATGSSSGRHWRESSACTAIWTMSTHGCRHVRADAAAGVDGSWPRDLCVRCRSRATPTSCANSWTSARTCGCCAVSPSATRIRRSREMRCGCHEIR